MVREPDMAYGVTYREVVNCLHSNLFFSLMFNSTTAHKVGRQVLARINDTLKSSNSNNI